MTKAEFIRRLKDFPDDTKILIEADGFLFSPLLFLHKGMEEERIVVTTLRIDLQGWIRLDEQRTDRLNREGD